MKLGKIIDADGHVDEMVPGAVDWGKYIEPAYKARGPRYGDPGEEHSGMYIDGEPFPKFGTKDPGIRGKQSPRMLHRERPGLWDSKVRVPHMDQDGIDLAVLYGSGIAERCSDLPDAGVGLAIARAYNNWLHDYCSYAPQRLKGAAAVALQDIEGSVAEANRAVTELGFVSVGVLPYCQQKTLMDPYFFPLYEELQRLDVPLGIHWLGSAEPVGQGRFHELFFTHIFQHSFEQMLASLAIIGGGVLDRFTKLRVAFLEGDSGWLPWWIDRLDGHYEKLANQVPAKARPSEYIKGSQCYFGCEGGEHTIAYTAGVIGEDRLLFASDYWHWDGKFPGAVSEIADRKDLKASLKRKLLGENAARLYRLN